MILPLLAKPHLQVLSMIALEDSANQLGPVSYDAQILQNAHSNVLSHIRFLTFYV